MLLWSVLKILIFMVLVAALTLGASYLLDLGDVVLVTVAGREFMLTPISAVIATLLLLLAVFIVLRVAGFLVATLRFLNGDETAISRYFNRRAEQRGYQALADSMMALAAGEGRLAIRKAERAESYLKRPDLTNLLVAQAAEMAGDSSRATESYKALLSDERTRFIGVRGLMQQKLEAGDTDTALKLAERAFAIRPAHEGVQDTLLQLQAGDEDWAGARKTLAAKLKSGAIPRDLHKRRDAVLALADARDALAEGREADARREATEANRLSPDLVPAAVMAARMALAEGKPRVATKAIRKAWEAAPHPDLAAAFAAIEPEESPAARIRRFRALLSRHPQATETRLLEAELHIANDDFSAARTALGDLAETEPTARSLTIMAAIERGEGAEEHLVRAWLAKAVTASRGPQWCCAACGHISVEWQPICGRCDAFDALEWVESKQSDAALAGAAQMLPLIVGSLEDHSEEAEEAEIVEETEDEPEIEEAAVILPPDALVDDGEPTKPTDAAREVN